MTVGNERRADLSDTGASDSGKLFKMNTRDIIAAITSTCFDGDLRAVLRGGITSNWQKLDIVLQMSDFDNCSAIKT